MVRPRIFIADDHTLVVEAFKNLLEPEFEVVGTASDGRQLLAAAEQLKPDVILLDIGLPLLDGMSAGQELHTRLPHTKIIVVTMYEEVEIAAEALQHWASAYLLKKSAGSELLKAVREVLKWNTYVTPEIRQRLKDEFVRDPHIERTRTLTPRQRDVLQLLAEGRTMKEAADVLHVTPRTVAFHKYRIMEEFGLKTNSDLVRFAIRERIIGMP
jgi:DNA-binding NarL/FixJ family response regulator